VIGRLVEYELDADDRLVWVSPSWDEFAVDNDAPELAGGACLGRRLPDFVTGAEMQLLWRELLGRCRSSAGAVTVTLRCDSPRVRRDMEATLVPGDRGRVRVRVATLSAETREKQPLLDRNAERSPDLLSMCSWCKAVRVGEEWAPLEEATERLGLLRDPHVPRVSHGICPGCHSQWMEDIAVP